MNYDPFAADIWSSGILLYIFLSNQHMFKSNDDMGDETKCKGALDKAFKIMKETGISDVCTNLMKKLLN